MTILWTSHEVAQATGGTPSCEWQATGFTIDSREIKKGDLFIALKGPIHDGHDHVQEAFEKGAVAAIVNEDFKGQYNVVRVKDTLQALNDLAYASRKRTQAKIIAVTGSFGKTSTKEALKLVLGHQGKVTASERSFNNFWGLPLSLCQLPQSFDYGVFEIGMNYPNEITPLSKLARPHIALITTVEKMHIENCGSYEGVADAKAEIFEGMDPGSKVILKKDNPMFHRLEEKAKSKGLDVVTFGSDPTADARLHENFYRDGRLFVRATVGSRELEYAVPAVGEHWAYNSLAVLTAVWLLGGNVELAAASLSQFQLLDGRGAVREFKVDGGSITVIDDSYNAGPGSMSAGIKTLGRLNPGPEGRRIAVMGNMAELGDFAKELHEALVDELVVNHVDKVFTTGNLMAHLFAKLPESMQGYQNDDLDDLAKKVCSFVRPGDVLLVKGSRGMRAYRGRMSKIVDALEELNHEKIKKSA